MYAYFAHSARVVPNAKASALQYSPPPLIRTKGLGERLQNERLRLAIRQSDIAEQSQHVRMTVYRYERGEQLPSLRFLAAAERLGMNIFGILSGEPARSLAGREFRLDLDGLPGRLRAERERLGFEQGDFAAATQIARPTQTGYENGYSLPSLEYIWLAQETGVDVRYLLSSQRAAMLLGWSDCERLAGALSAAASLLSEDEWRSPAALADKVMQLLIPHGEGEFGTRAFKD